MKPVVAQEIGIGNVILHGPLVGINNISDLISQVLKFVVPFAAIIFFSINGVGFREKKEQELIFWERDTAFVEAHFDENGANTDFQIFLSLRGEAVEKKFTVSKTRKTHKQYQEYQTKAVLFAPEHI